MRMIAQSFDSEQALYYYTDISTALQMNDGEMKVFVIQIGRIMEKLTFIHYDLHCRITGEVLYGVIGRNPPNPSTEHSDQWMWKIDGFMTANEIARRFGVGSHELPRSSRESPRFKEQLFGAKSPIREQLVEETVWPKVQQIKSLRRKRNTKKIKMKIRITEREWKMTVKQSMSDQSLPMVPVVVNRNSSHWIEWIKMVYIKSYGVFVGISCSDLGAGRWSVQSIDLDSGRIYNKYRLVGLQNMVLDRQLRAIKADNNVTEIQFIRDDIKLYRRMMMQQQAAPMCAPSDKYGNGPNAPLPTGGEEWIDEILSDVLQKEHRCKSAPSASHGAMAA